MSAARHSSPQHAAAAVLEFICLYTHDLRRKQKRWQDGRLKYHSFNKRIMVYDDRGNFVGDTHWHHDGDFAEGEEVELSRGGVRVQVQELIHRTNQDLTELLEKRAKEKERRQIQATAARSPAAIATMPRSVVRPVPPDHPQPRHRPLLEVIGTPSGHHGRAMVPRESPYEHRHQSAESPDERASKRRRFDEPPPSRSGHARALFGQTLTLSATPTSSMPVRREVAAVEPKTVLGEHPKTSSHFNRPVERERTVQKEIDRLPRSKNVSDEGAPHSRQSIPCALSRDKHVQERREVFPEDDDVVEIHASGPAPKGSTRPTRGEKNASGATKAGEQPVLRPNATLKSLDSSGSIRRINGPQVRDSETKHPPRRNENPVTPERSKSLDPTSTTKRKTADGSSSGPRREEPELASMTRRPPEHVTELRIKPRKKRGLMMMSELPQMVRRQPKQATPATTAPETSTAKTIDKQRDHLRSPLPQPNSEHETQSVEKDSGDSAQRKVSIELDGDDDPFQSPTPGPQDLLDAGAGGVYEDEVETATALGSAQQATNNECGTKVGRQIDTEKVPAADHDEPTHVLHDAQVPPPEKPCDSCKMPSSSAEKHPAGLSCLAPEASAKSNALRGHNIVSSPDDLEEMEAASLWKMTPRRRACRRARRRIVVDDEDEEGEPSKGAQRTSTNVNEAVEPSSDTQHSASEDQILPRRPAKALKRKLIARKDSEGIGMEHVDDEPARKKSTRPNMTTRVIRSKSGVDGNGAKLESADGQSSKRRKLTRKTRSHVSESEMIPLSSEQEDSEEEPPSKKDRMENKSKALKSKPRLTRIKQSVKSRELIGFNLSALNVPLGLRGIGVPFGIPSSPADEPVRMQIGNEALGNLPLESTTIHGVGSTRTIDEAQEFAVVQPSENAELPVVATPLCGTDSTGRGGQECQAKPRDRHPLSAEPDTETPRTVMSGEGSAAKSKHGMGKRSSPISWESPSQLTPIDASMLEEAALAVREQASNTAEDLTMKPTSLRVVSETSLDVAPTSADDVTVSTVAAVPQIAAPIFQTEASTMKSANASVNATTSSETTRICTVQTATAAFIPLQSAYFARINAGATAASVSGPATTLSPEQSEATEKHAPRIFLPQNSTELPTPQYDTGSLVNKPIVETTTVESDLVEDAKATAGSATSTQQQTPISLPRSIPTTRTINGLRAQTHQPGPHLHLTTEHSPKTTPIPRIANPASRGRKAALKSDAAGKAPQRILPPTQPSALISTSSAVLAVTQPTEPLKKPERPKKKMAFPGFQSARGEGPWSREAFDLLESGRPV